MTQGYRAAAPWLLAFEVVRKDRLESRVCTAPKAASLDPVSPTPSREPDCHQTVICQARQVWANVRRMYKTTNPSDTSNTVPSWSVRRLLGDALVSLATWVTAIPIYLIAGETPRSTASRDDPNSQHVPARPLANHRQVGRLIRRTNDNVTHDLPASTWTSPKTDEMLYALNEQSRRTREGQPLCTLETAALPHGIEDSHRESPCTLPLENAMDRHPSKPDPLVTLESITPVAEVLMERLAFP